MLRQLSLLLLSAGSLLAVDPATWEQLNPKLDQLVDMEEESANLPRSSWFGKDQKSQRKDMEGLLDEAVGVLAGSEAVRIRRMIEEKRDAIQGYEHDISDYRRNRLSAPEESYFRTTRDDYDRRIEEAEDAIEREKEAIESLRDEFAEAVRSYGLKIDEDQVDLLLNSVLGDDIVTSLAVYDNVKVVSVKLMELTEASQENLDISRRYYGMHLILLQVLEQMQANFINGIDQEYLPRIEGIREEVTDLQKETRRLIRTADTPVRKQFLEKNLEAQDLTLETAALYKRHLEDQRQKMEKALAQTRKDVEVARNTLKTVTASGELVAMIRDTQQTFDLLSGIQVPNLLTFENLQMKQEFASLSRRIAN